MHAVIFCGIQASGKSSFYKQRFVDSHLHLNMDMLRTRHRELILLEAILLSKTPFVADNCNPTRDERARYIQPAKASHFRVTGYYFSSRSEDAIARNSLRAGKAKVPDKAILGTCGKLQIPSMEEGFDELFFVRLVPPNEFVVEEWRNEV